MFFLILLICNRRWLFERGIFTQKHHLAIRRIIIGFLHTYGRESCGYKHYALPQDYIFTLILLSDYQQFDQEYFIKNLCSDIAKTDIAEHNWVSTKKLNLCLLKFKYFTVLFYAMECIIWDRVQIIYLYICFCRACATLVYNSETILWYFIYEIFICEQSYDIFICVLLCNVGI